MTDIPTVNPTPPIEDPDNTHGESEDKDGTPGAVPDGGEKA